MPHTNFTDPVHRAAVLLSALASTKRQALLAEVTRRIDSGESTTFSALSTALEWTAKEIGKESSRLIDAGLLQIQKDSLISHLGVLRESVEALDGLAPLARAIAERPTTARFFRHGRLTVIPEDHTKKVDICRVVVQLLPFGRELTEAQVNELLRPVHNDVAALRRLLFDTGMVDRAASTGYLRLQ